MIADAEALVADLRELSDGSLRVVATYDREGYDFVFVREDVGPTARQNAADVHEDLILQGIGTKHLEALFEAGQLNCSMHRFEELTAFHFVAGEYTGLFVSVDSDADLPLASFTERCRRALPD